MATEVGAQTRITRYLGSDIYYLSRGIEYQFEWYDREYDEHGEIYSQTVVVYAFRMTDASIIWSASTTAYRGDRVIDVVRAARNAAQRRVMRGE